MLVELDLRMLPYLFSQKTICSEEQGWKYSFLEKGFKIGVYINPSKHYTQVQISPKYRDAKIR